MRCGFDMFWIVGGRPIFQEAAKLWEWPWLVWFARQLEHPVWHGFTVWDSIFPLFLFIAGVAMPYSFARRWSAAQRRRIYIATRLCADWRWWRWE